ncbi:MAG: sensor histidine kinase [Massiliimalia sp.]|jgi:two-component system sensor histidine kinase AgrC
MKEWICYAILYLAEGLTAAVYFNSLFELKRKKWFVTLEFILGYSILFFIFQFDNLIVNMIAFLTINAALLYINYFCKIWLSVLHAAYLSFAMLITEFLTLSALSIVFLDYSAFKYNFIALICSGCLSKLFYFIIMIVSSKILKPYNNNKPDFKKILLFCLLPIASLIIAVAYIHIGMTTAIPSITETMMVTSVLFLLVSNILSFIILDHTQKVAQENFSMQLRLQKEEADTLYYTMLQKQYDQQRVLIHDIKNHTQMIRGLLEQNRFEELEHYLDDFEALPGFKKKVHLCDNTVCNMILLQTVNQCRNKNITFDYDIRDQSLSFLEPTDITALFGNLLSNAFEAAAESEEKTIELRVQHRPEQKITMIVLQNSCDCAPEANQEGGYLSHKADKLNHGLGLKSIHRIVKKYHGSCDMHYDSHRKQFHTVIMLKRP